MSQWLKLTWGATGKCEVLKPRTKIRLFRGVMPSADVAIAPKISSFVEN
ncbi:hypothetical protein [Anabaena sp. CCY 0017]